MTSTTGADTSDPPSPSKRRMSSGSSPNPNRPVKRRASKACACCRSRKVRCNVVENGVPCTNCKLDQVECVLLESRRRRHVLAPKSTTSASESSTSPGKTTTVGSPSPARSVTSLAMIDESGEAMNPASPASGDEDMSMTGDMIDHYVPHMIYQTQGLGSVTHDPHLRRSLSQPSQTVGISSPHLATRSVATLTRTASSLSSRLPHFIRPCAPSMNSDDMDYLLRKGALSIPPKALRLELLRCFIQYVWPFSPLVDLRSFLSGIFCNEGNPGGTSLLLYQAAMFAGSAFADMQQLKAAGYMSRRAARKEFFTRARLLYDFDYESDRLTLIQALLLMTHWYESPDDQKDTWHWMGISLSLAHTLGLHRDSPNSPGAGAGDNARCLRRRIWWSLYMRDRMVALGMRRPTRLQTSDCDVSMLTLEDFDTRPLPLEIMQKLGIHYLQDQIQLTALATTCIAKAKLCICISHILDTQYKSLHSKDSSHTTSMILVPQRHNELNGLQACDAELESWSNDLPLDAQHDSWSSPNEEGRVLFLSRALLRLNYCTALSALHRPRVLSTTPKSSVCYDSRVASQAKVRYAAVETTDVLGQLQSRDLIRRLSTEGVTVLLPAVIIHLLDVKSPDDNVRLASIKRVNRCMQALRQLRDIYASADYATVLLEAAITKADLQSTANGEILKTSSVQTLVYDLTPPPEDAFDSTLPHFSNVDGTDSFADTMTPPPSARASVGAEPSHVAGVSARSPVPTSEKHQSRQQQQPHMPPANFASQSPFEQALTSLNFLDGIVMPYDDHRSVDSRPATAHAVPTMSADLDSFNGTTQGENGMFGMDLDMMVDLAGRDNLDMDMESALF